MSTTHETPADKALRLLPERHLRAACRDIKAALRRGRGIDPELAKALADRVEYLLHAGRLSTREQMRLQELAIALGNVRVS